MKPVCSWKHPPQWYLEKLKSSLDINTVRVPFSHDYLKANNFRELDDLVATCRDLHLQVILDWHRNVNSHQSPQPTTDLPHDVWIQAWIQLLSRYVNDTTVWGVGAYNEYQISNASEVILQQSSLVKAIEIQYPKRFNYFLGCTQWGVNCSHVNFTTLEFVDRIHVEIHKYQFAENPVSWNVTMPFNTSNQWFVGEFGWKEDQTEQVQWADHFINYLLSRNITDACFWTIALSGDTGGLWKDDCDTFEISKAQRLHRLWNGTSSLRGF